MTTPIKPSGTDGTSSIDTHANPKEKIACVFDKTIKIQVYDKIYPCLRFYV